MHARIKIDVEKIYRIDDAGNIDVERSWTLTNQTHKDVELSELAFYVGETADALANAKARDSSGSLDVIQEKQRSEIKLTVFPRANSLGSLQKYKMTLLYQLPSNVHKLGDVWLFSDIISGMNTSGFGSLLSDKMDLRLCVVLPKLKKSFWQSILYESSPLCRELTREERTSEFAGKRVLEWTSSLFSDRHYRVELIYGVKTNTKLTSFLTAVATVIVVGLIKYGFDLLQGR